MKSVRYILALLLASLCSIGTKAQNVLRVPDITAQTGNVQLPFEIENTSEVEAVQFDLTLPEGFTAGSVATTTDRCDGHSVSLQPMGGQVWRVLLYSPQNLPLHGTKGTVAYLPIVIPTTAEEGASYALGIAGAVLATASGENVLTEAVTGSIHVSKLPDLTVTDVNAGSQSLTPGDKLVCSWQVHNVGELPTGGGWSEQLWLVAADGTSKLMTTTYYDKALDAQGVVSRQAEVTVPQLLGIDGDAQLQVRLVPNEDTGESTSAQGNNTALSASHININKVLYFDISPSTVQENSGRTITARLSRSGSWAETQAFSMTATEDSRLQVPATVSIAAGQSGTVFHLTVQDNDVLDAASVVTITAAGNGYSQVARQLTIEDNELPELQLSTSKEIVNEGETFQLTITTSRVPLEPLTVTLTSDNSRRFSFPSQVTIPAGETSATAEVQAVENNIIDTQESFTFRASASRHANGECIVLLLDNDMPTLSFTLTPSEVSESAGYTALLGVIKRTDHFDTDVTLRLTDNSDGLLYYSTKTIVLEKGHREVQCVIGVSDDHQVDGNHDVTVTATVYAASCNCEIKGDNVAELSANITILDDDGPALNIKTDATALLEGSKDNVFTIGHNVSTEQSVTVSVSSDCDDMLEYDHEVTIPAGQSAAELKVNVKSNEQSGDDRVVSFKTEADGFTIGTCYVLLTDQTLPDATVSLDVAETETEAETTLNLGVTVSNKGNSMLQSGVPVKVTFSGSSESIMLQTPEAVAPGESTSMSYAYQLPAITGQHHLVATVNPDNSVKELIYANNSSEQVDIALLPRFMATAQADKDVYAQGESINISGQAKGSASSNVDVEIYIVNEGARQTISATTDANGRFSATWTPQSRQAGHFDIGACYPGAGNTEVTDAFDVYGLRTSNNYQTCTINHTDTYTGTISVSNPGVLPQTGLAVVPVGTSDNCQFSFAVSSTDIDAGGTAQISYSIQANAPSDILEYQRMPIEITTAEGTKLSHDIYYYVYPLHAKLEASVTTINTTVTEGGVRFYPIAIRNIGRAETGRITLALPPCIEAASADELPSLAQGDSATIVLRFKPTADMRTNIPVSSYFGINCSNGDGVRLSYTLTMVSETTGGLTIDAVDQYTARTAEAPHVSGAKVAVTMPYTNEKVAEGTTDDSGLFTCELPGGFYNISVTADNHDSHYGTVVVDPGVNKTDTVFLNYQAVTYTWDMQETTVEDVYEVETVVKYEVDVPKPVLVMTLPEEHPIPGVVYPVVLVNKGLVKAVDVRLSMQMNTGYTFEFLNEPTLDELGAEQSVVFYTKMVPATDDASKLSEENNCFRLTARTYYKDVCEQYVSDEVLEVIKTWGHCTSTVITTGGGGGGGGAGGPGSPLPWSGATYGAGYTTGSIISPTTTCWNPDVCTTITLSFNQTLVLTRQAFIGTLTVNNGFADTALEDVKMNVEVRASDGMPANSVFEIHANSLEGFEGETNLNAAWTLGGGKTGVASILFIPTNEAAPDEPKEYSFGGSFSYKDPSNGLTVTVNLNPITLTVNPTPLLELTYFMQRDIIGDDPLTTEVEPMQAAEFALVINNKGNGNADNVRITTQQPQIIENNSGLLIEMKIDSSQVNGQKASLFLGESHVNDFGSIAAHEQAYGQWWLSSTLLGHFIEYSVTATHVTSYGNPNLSLLDTVTIHELVHGFTVNTEGDMPLRGFLVNDVADTEDMPDQVYFTDATQKAVSMAAELTPMRQSNTEWHLTVTAGTEGWNYGSLTDPTQGRQKLVRVVRLSDGAELPMDNVWQTDRTLRDGRPPLYENRLHIVANMPTEGDTYVLTFEPKPEVELAVESITGLPDVEVTDEQVESLSITFNKAIDDATFTTADLTLHREGVTQDVTAIGIRKISERQYSLDLSEVTQQDGFYVLTVQTADILDAEGFPGAVGKQVSWTQFTPSVGLASLQDDALSVRLSPVPLGEWLYIGGNYSVLHGVDIYDMRGVRLLHCGCHAADQAVSVGSLPAGIYHVVVNTDRGAWRTKVVKR